MSETPERERLPFERKSKKKKSAKKTPPTSVPAKKKAGPSKSGNWSTRNGVPEVVSQRMIARMVFFSGIPTVLGMSSFFVFYLVVSRDVLDIPTYVVFSVSLLFFGLGVVGLSYSIFSTSWEETAPGSVLGIEEFRLNLRRTLQAWRSEREAAQAAKND